MAACGIKSKQIRGLCDAVRKTLLKWCGKSLKQIRIEKLCEAIAKTASKWIVRPRITTDHIDRLCDDVYQSLSNAIQAQIRQLTARDPLETEIEAHETFGIERSLHFTGRADMLRDIEHYIRGSDRNPLVVQGVSGTGKSALMARAAQRVESNHGGGEVVFRFIGATPRSSDPRALLEDLCRQISKSYGADESGIPSDYLELVREFPARLALATAGKPLILFLDALDQLADTGDARRLNWLPAELPPHVRLIVSTLPGDCLAAFESKLPKGRLIELGPMPSEEAEELLDLWLQEAGRTVQPHRRKEVLDKFDGCGLRST